MTRKKIACVAATAFFGAVLVASAGDAYKYEATNEWFSVTAAEAAFSDSRWTKPADCEAEVVDTLIEFDAEADSPLKYTPADASGPVALVNLHILVTANATTPTLEGLDNAQAALTVVTNTTSGGLNWVGLAKVSDTTQWVTLSGAAPTAGDGYDVEIALDNRTEKKIRYSVKGTGDASYTVLTYGGDAWLGNPQSTDRVTSVAFAGTGKLGDFSGVSIRDDGAEITSTGETAGFDFTNGTVTAVVTLDDVGAGAHTAVLTVVDFATGEKRDYASEYVTSGEQITWNLSGLTAGGTYSYTITVKSGNAERAVKSGTFTAANWNDSAWFSATNNVENNGSFDAGAAFADGKWDVSGDANFNVTDIAPGSNAVSRVDTRYSFETFVDTASLEGIEDAVGGLVAVNGGVWYAYTGAEGGMDGWHALTGGIEAETNTEYVIRAEFDFLSSTHRVRYLVSDDGVEFVPMSLGGNEWISLASQVPGSLSSVGMSGKGYVKSISAKVSDRAVAESNGVKYNTLWEALRNGNGTVTLLTNATLKPSEISGGKFGPYTIIVGGGGYRFVFDKSQLTGKWKFVQKDDKWYLMKPGATYIFF